MLEPVTVRLADLAVAPWKWKHEDHVPLVKLQASLATHGQIQALVVRELPDGRLEAISGRKVLASLLVLGRKTAAAVNVGRVDDDTALTMSISLDLGFEVDYPALAVVLLGLSRTLGDALPERVPIPAERIRYYVELVDYDWTSLGKSDDAQMSLLGADEDVPDAPEPVQADPGEEIRPPGDVLVAPGLGSPVLDDLEPPPANPVTAPVRSQGSLFD